MIPRTMCKAENATPAYLRAVMPSTLKAKNAQFFKPSQDIVKTLVYLAVSVYPAKNADKLVIVRKDGSVVMNATVYAGFEDNTYTTLKCDTAVSQALSVMGDIDLTTEGTTEFEDFEPFKVGFVAIKAKMGKKEYDYWAFDPKD